MGKRKYVTILEHFVAGRPGTWSRKNLLERSYRLARFCQDIIGARGEEIGNARDRDYKSQQVVHGLAKQLTDRADQVERLQEVASAAAWVIADHMSGSYNAIVSNDGRNELINSEQHGDGICRVLASHLAKLDTRDMDGCEDFIRDDFQRTHDILSRNQREAAR